MNSGIFESGVNPSGKIDPFKSVADAAKPRKGSRLPDMLIGGGIAVGIAVIIYVLVLKNES